MVECASEDQSETKTEDEKSFGRRTCPSTNKLNDLDNGGISTVDAIKDFILDFSG